jgi:hypothetical protein
MIECNGFGFEAATKQLGIGRFTLTPQGVDMADGGLRPPRLVASIWLMAACSRLG